MNESSNKRIKTNELHEIICRTLEDALKSSSHIKTDENGFVTQDSLREVIEEVERQKNEEEKERLKRQKDNLRYRQVMAKDDQKKKIAEELAKIEKALKDEKYNGIYSFYDDINKLINNKLAKIGKEITINKTVEPYTYKGYKGLLEDYRKAAKFRKYTPVDKNTFSFIKGTLDFDTMAIIRSYIKDAKEEYEYGPEEPFICIEGSIYEFTPDFDEQILRERELLLQFAKGIIYRNAVKVTYRALYKDQSTELEFHPHYIRKVGNKLMVYGLSKEFGQEQTAEGMLVNLVVGRVQTIEDLHVEYVSAKDMGLDYNNAMFCNRMTFNAPDISMTGTEACEQVVLKVRKLRKPHPSNPTPWKPRTPFARILAEPLHHSQRVCTDFPETDDFGYISLMVADCQYIRPILMAWGSDIEVIRPESLRVRIQDEVRAMTEIYFTRTATGENR